jgi:hypothetical protein
MDGHTHNSSSDIPFAIEWRTGPHQTDPSWGTAYRRALTAPSAPDLQTLFPKVMTLSRPTGRISTTQSRCCVRYPSQRRRLQTVAGLTVRSARRRLYQSSQVYQSEPISNVWATIWLIATVNMTACHRQYDWSPPSIWLIATVNITDRHRQYDWSPPSIWLIATVPLSVRTWQYGLVESAVVSVKVASLNLDI